MADAALDRFDQSVIIQLPRPYLLFLGDVAEAGYAKTLWPARLAPKAASGNSPARRMRWIWDCRS